MSTIRRREVADVTPLQALFFTALLAVSGSSERVRRTAIDTFERAAMPAIWGFLTRDTEARVSWLRLLSITHEATRRFVHVWPTSRAATVASMMEELERCAHTAAFMIADIPAAVACNRRLGVLTLLAYDERMHLLQCVQPVLTPEELCALYALVEHERADAGGRPEGGDALAGAIERLESLLLGACTYTLGTPPTVSHRHLAA